MAVREGWQVGEGGEDRATWPLAPPAPAPHPEALVARRLVALLAEAEAGYGGVGVPGLPGIHPLPHPAPGPQAVPGPRGAQPWGARVAGGEGGEGGRLGGRGVGGVGGVVGRGLAGPPVRPPRVLGELGGHLLLLPQQGTLLGCQLRATMLRPSMLCPTLLWPSELWPSMVARAMLGAAVVRAARAVG